MNILLAAILPESEPLWWDSIRLIIQSQSSLAQFQYNLAMYGITLLIAIALLLATASWLTNVYIIRRERKREREEDFEKLSKGISERIKKEIEEMEKKIRESIDKEFILFNAEKARLFALAAWNAKLWEGGARWWASAIEGYAKAGEEEIVRISVNSLIQSLQNCKKIENDDKKKIENKLGFIPKILYEEKKQIEDMLDKLSKKLP
ncbi:MAG: hypothetical protein HWN66_20530 [Candidatus Helarchaeota archaeon]|nr:hypothetical protein [Candidatus Helarchaeota archaeon]